MKYSQINCTKGKLTKKVSEKNPKYPGGYKGELDHYLGQIRRYQPA